MTHGLRIAVLVVVLYGLGCTGQNVKRFYTLTNLQTQTGAGDRAAPIVCARPLVVSFFDTVAPFDDAKIVFRTDNYEVKFYNYRLWIDEPPEMLRKLIAERIVDTRLFSSVESYLESSIDHLLLSVKLLALEDLVQGEGKRAEHTGRLALRFELKDPREEKLIWSYEFDERQAYEGDEAKALIEALNAIYNKELTEMLPSLAEAIGSFPGCRPEPPADEAK